MIEFEIDISNEEHLNNLIEQAKKEQDTYDVWKGFKKSFSGLTTYILLPIITILISEFFKDVGWETILVRAVVILMIYVCIVLITCRIKSIWSLRHKTGLVKCHNRCRNRRGIIV